MQVNTVFVLHDYSLQNFQCHENHKTEIRRSCRKRYVQDDCTNCATFLALICKMTALLSQAAKNCFTCIKQVKYGIMLFQSNYLGVWNTVMSNIAMLRAVSQPHCSYVRQKGGSTSRPERKFHGSTTAGLLEGL